TTGYLHENTNQLSDSLANQAIYDGVKAFYKSPVDYKTFTDKYKLSSSIIGPTISNDITTHSFYAIILSLIAIFIYILVRFRSWRYSVGVIVSLIHDTIIVMGAFSILAGFLPFSLEVDEQFVAAILTVIGYSVND